jgi:hypothetical protein
MATTLYEQERQHNRALVRILSLANLAFASLVLLSWTAISMFVTEPIEWATWRGFQSVKTWEGVFAYPYVMLWAVPLGAVFGSWVAEKMKKWKLAAGFVLVPVIYFGLTIAMYYIVPGGAH